MTPTRYRFASALTLAAGIACSPTADRGGGSAALDSAGTVTASAQCFRTSESVLARRPGTVADGPPGLTGWIRIDRESGADTGAASLVDSDGTSLAGTWRRVVPDSIGVIGFNDFLRVDLRLAIADSVATGMATAHSDAATERDSTGKQVEFRREWSISARQTSCDSVPAPRSA